MNNNNKNAWDENFAYLPLQQAYEYGEFMRRIGRDVRRLEIPVSSDNQAFLQIISRKFSFVKFSTALRAPIFSKPEQQISLQKNDLKTQKNEFLILQPDYGQISNARKVMSGGAFAVLHLSDNPSDKFDSKWRNSLRRAEKTPQHEVKFMQDSKLAFSIINEESKKRSEKNYSSFSKTSMMALAMHFLDCNDLFAAKAEISGEMVAGAIFLRTNRTMHYFCSYSSLSGRKANSHNLILSQAFEKFHKIGVEYSDLGMIDDENSSGLCHFKLSSGAKPIISSGSFLIL